MIEGREVILQTKRTLDEALLTAYKTYRNGCSFTLIFDKEDILIGLGCYLLVNLIQGDEWLIFNWIKLNQPDGFDPYHRDYLENIKPVSIHGIVAPDIIVQMLKRKPCECCGAPFFRSKEDIKVAIQG